MAIMNAAEVLETLLEVEWAGMTGMEERCCPICHVIAPRQHCNNEPHAPSCRLAAAIATMRAQAEREAVPALNGHDIATPAFDAYLKRIHGGSRFDDLPEKDHEYLLDAVQSHNGNILIAWHIFKTGYHAAMKEKAEHESGYRSALQAIADAEPAINHVGHSEQNCEECERLIGEARKALEEGEGRHERP